MTKTSDFLEGLGVSNIDGYQFIDIFKGGSALSCLYKNGDKKIVIKFLIAPRNEVEAERFKLEFSALNNNRAKIKNPEHPDLKGFFLGPETSYPLPKIVIPLESNLGGQVNYFGYEYEKGELLSEIDTSSLDLIEKYKLLHRLASGLSYFNQTGYSHRDLHPNNILLLPGSKMLRSDDNVADHNDPRIKFLDLGQCQSVNIDTYDMFDFPSK